MKKYIGGVLISFFLFFSCSKDYELERSIFIEDPVYSGLPEYSEWGYNTFGAYIDRTPFTSDSDLPAKIIVNSDTLNLLLKGTMKYNQDVDLKFSFIGYSPKDYDELIELKDKTINLTESNCIVTLTKGGVATEVDVFEGRFFMKNVQNLYVDKKLTKAIISGEFNFKAIINQEPFAVSNGRFDLGIGYDNFYNF